METALWKGRESSPVGGLPPGGPDGGPAKLALGSPSILKPTPSVHAEHVQELVPVSVLSEIQPSGKVSV